MDVGFSNITSVYEALIGLLVAFVGFESLQRMFFSSYEQKFKVFCDKRDLIKGKIENLESSINDFSLKLFENIKDPTTLEKKISEYTQIKESFNTLKNKHQTFYHRNNSISKPEDEFEFCRKLIVSITAFFILFFIIILYFSGYDNASVELFSHKIDIYLFVAYWEIIIFFTYLVYVIISIFSFEIPLTKKLKLISSERTVKKINTSIGFKFIFLRFINIFILTGLLYMFSSKIPFHFEYNKNLILLLSISFALYPIFILWIRFFYYLENKIKRIELDLVTHVLELEKLKNMFPKTSSDEF